MRRVFLISSLIFTWPFLLYAQSTDTTIVNEFRYKDGKIVAYNDKGVQDSILLPCLHLSNLHIGDSIQTANALLCPPGTWPYREILKDNIWVYAYLILGPDNVVGYIIITTEKDIIKEITLSGRGLCKSDTFNFSSIHINTHNTELHSIMGPPTSIRETEWGFEWIYEGMPFSFGVAENNKVSTITIWDPLFKNKVKK